MNEEEREKCGKCAKPYVGFAAISPAYCACVYPDLRSRLEYQKCTDPGEESRSADHVEVRLHEGNAVDEEHAAVVTFYWRDGTGTRTDKRAYGYITKAHATQLHEELKKSGLYGPVEVAPGRSPPRMGEVMNLRDMLGDKDKRITELESLLADATLAASRARR